MVMRSSAKHQEKNVLIFTSITRMNRRASLPEPPRTGAGCQLPPPDVLPLSIRKMSGFFLVPGNTDGGTQRVSA